MKLKIAAAGILWVLTVIPAPAQNNWPVGSESQDGPITFVRMNSAVKPLAAAGQPAISSVNSAADYSLVVAPG